jgi:hypothetical protein
MTELKTMYIIFFNFLTKSNFHVIGNLSLFQLAHIFFDHLSPIYLEIPVYNLQIVLKSPHRLSIFYYTNLYEY